jgi:hypothetical protein
MVRDTSSIEHRPDPQLKLAPPHGGRSGGITGTGPEPAATLPPGRQGAGFWSVLTLSQRFALMGGVVMLAGMAVIGSWVSHRIEGGVVRNTAVATALYMDNFIAPVSQELGRFDTLSPEVADVLHDIFSNTPLGERVVSFKIWKQGGLVAHASNPALIGRVFEPTASLRAAWSGQVMVEFDDLAD